MLSNYDLLRNVQLNEVTIKEEQPQTKEGLLNTTDDPFSIKNYVEISVNVAPQTIALTNNCTSIVLPLNDLQVYSIKNALDKRIDVRPTIHDTLKALMAYYNITLELVKITEIKNDVYLSELIFAKDNKILNIDSKPSDSIALALRTGNKIYLKKEVLDRMGKNTC